MEHSLDFERYSLFIRFFPDVSLIHLCSELSIYETKIQKFVSVNYHGLSSLAEFHGKAVALDIKDHDVPFPSLFIIHEIRARGFHPFFQVEQLATE